MSKTTSTPVPVAPGASVTMSAAQLTRALRNTPIRFVGGKTGMAEVRAESDGLAFHGLLMAVRIS